MFVSRTNFKMEFKMLTLTKQASIAIAVTLGVALIIPVSISIPAVSASSNIIMLNRAAPPLRHGNPVGPLAKRKSIGVAGAGLALRGPVVDFGLYYGHHMQFAHSKKGTTRGSGANTLFLVSSLSRKSRGTSPDCLDSP
jgi:hypothetical protein